MIELKESSYDGAKKKFSLFIVAVKCRVRIK